MSSRSPSRRGCVGVGGPRRILQRYVERFNSRDWDGLRELISADARLLVADRYSGSFAAGGYLRVYSRMQVTWRLTLGEVDDEPSIILLNQRNGEWEIEGIIRLVRLPALPVDCHSRVHRSAGID